MSKRPFNDAFPRPAAGGAADVTSSSPPPLVASTTIARYSPIPATSQFHSVPHPLDTWQQVMRDADGHLRPYHVTQQAGQPDTHWMHWGGVEWLQMHRNDQGAYSHNGFAQTNVRPVNKLDLRRLALCNLARLDPYLGIPHTDPAQLYPDLSQLARQWFFLTYFEDSQRKLHIGFVTGNSHVNETATGTLHEHSRLGALYGPGGEIIRQELVSQTVVSLLGGRLQRPFAALYLHAKVDSQGHGKTDGSGRPEIVQDRHAMLIRQSSNKPGMSWEPHFYEMDYLPEQPDPFGRWFRMKKPPPRPKQPVNTQTQPIPVPFMVDGNLWSPMAWLPEPPLSLR